MFDIIELQHELTQNRLEANGTAKEEENNYSQVRARIASRNKDINILWKRFELRPDSTDINGSS
jgi:hypothetical protein